MDGPSFARLGGPDLGDHTFLALDFKDDVLNVLFDERSGPGFAEIGMYTLVNSLARFVGVAREVEVLFLLAFPMKNVLPSVTVKILQVAADVKAFHVDADVNRAVRLLRPIARLARLVTVFGGEKDGPIVGDDTTLLEVQHLADQ